jgi:predicted nucleic acid-binding protein
VNHIKPLAFKTIIPDAVYDEHTRIGGAALTMETLGAWGLEVRGTGPDGVSRVAELVRDSPALSTPDLFALVATEESGALLLTGDKNLRALAERLGVQTHGVMWVFDELVNSALLDPATAISRLTIVMANNLRLPASECHKRLTRWQERVDGGGSQSSAHHRMPGGLG